ncbi:TlpA family protein disulfide reductase [Polaribacter sp. WD7]|uniref:TlpA family protein disulfide reductase n=1 Tax=Polaribacter sp. WD7 TaxID=2269061 RepID=UPI000DF22F40|nr:TlpA disulfide reductase family protein [Polaribacter sp. WD7]RCS28102.1 TlpA family protein disulfide reductase [Polaribacter sp. WD7]
MKKLNIVLLLVIILVSCTNTPKDYVSLSGQLQNNTDSILSIITRTGIAKTIVINKDGSFKDTLRVPKAEIYTLEINREKRAPLFLKNGYDITIKGNIDEDIMTTLEYSGEGSNNSKFIVAQLKKGKDLGDPNELFNLEEKAFDKKIAAIKKEYDSILASYHNLDSTLVNLASKQNEQMFSYFHQVYANNLIMGKGRPSPKFKGYVDYKGGKKSLDSFKGKYVYIDVWATWCGPCIQQIPYLKNLEKKYHDKNIEFVSISTDESRRSGGSWEAAEKKWRDFVKEKQLSGVQLWSGQDFTFQQAYQITGIPRFILIDPQGNIVDANAPRPSEPRLEEILNALDL